MSTLCASSNKIHRGPSIRVCALSPHFSAGAIRNVSPSCLSAQYVRVCVQPLNACVLCTHTHTRMRKISTLVVRDTLALRGREGRSEPNRFRSLPSRIASGLINITIKRSTHARTPHHTRLSPGININTPRVCVLQYCCLIFNQCMRVCADVRIERLPKPHVPPEMPSHYINGRYKNISAPLGMCQQVTHVGSH